MPRNSRARRRRSPPRLPPRPPAEAQSATTERAAGLTAPESTLRGTRPERLVERDAPYLASELRRVASVSAACLALLALLIAADRLG